VRVWGVLPLLHAREGETVVTVCERAFKPLALWLWAEPDTIVESVRVGHNLVLTDTPADRLIAPGAFGSLHKAASYDSGVMPWRIDAKLAKAWVELSEVAAGDPGGVLPVVPAVPAGTLFSLRVLCGRVRAGAWVGRVAWAPGSAEPSPDDLVRYAAVHEQWGTSSSRTGQTAADLAGSTVCGQSEAELAEELARLGLCDVTVHAFQNGSAVLVLGVRTDVALQRLSELPDGSFEALNRSE
jgi:hypothetical protein